MQLKMLTIVANCIINWTHLINSSQFGLVRFDLVRFGLVTNLDHY